MFNLNGVYANVEQAVILLGVTKSYITRLIREERIEAIRIGREWLIPVTDGKVNVLPKRK